MGVPLGVRRQHRPIARPRIQHQRGVGPDRVVKTLREGGVAACIPTGPGTRREFKGGGPAASGAGVFVGAPCRCGKAWRGAWDRSCTKPLARVGLPREPFEVGPGTKGRAARIRAEAELAGAVRETRWDDGATDTG